MSVELQLTPKTKRPVGEPCCEPVVYPDVEHGFNNDTTPRFNEAAAKQAWERTIALFNRTLREGGTGHAAHR